MDLLCWVCQQYASSRCSRCQQPICRKHEQLGLNERRQRESLCPPCAERQHQERLRTRPLG